MKTLLLSAFVLFASGAAAELPIAEPWKSATTAELAAKLLPPEIARGVVGHKVSPPIMRGEPPFSITFYAAPRATDGFCEMNTYYVSGLPAPDRFHPLVELRLGACPDDPNAIFAHVNPGTSAEGAKQALRSLEWATRIARSDTPLPFDLECVSELTPNPCDKGARAVLAKLPLEKTFIVANWNFAIAETQPGQMLWDVRVTPTADGIRSIQVIWKIPPPA